MHLVKLQRICRRLEICARHTVRRDFLLRTKSEEFWTAKSFFATSLHLSVYGGSTARSRQLWAWRWCQFWVKTSLRSWCDSLIEWLLRHFVTSIKLRSCNVDSQPHKVTIISAMARAVSRHGHTAARPNWCYQSHHEQMESERENKEKRCQLSLASAFTSLCFNFLWWPPCHNCPWRWLLSNGPAGAGRELPTGWKRTFLSMQSSFILDFVSTKKCVNVNEPKRWSGVTREKLQKILRKKFWRMTLHQFLHHYQHINITDHLLRAFMFYKDGYGKLFIYIYIFINNFWFSEHILTISSAVELIATQSGLTFF